MKSLEALTFRSNLGEKGDEKVEVDEVQFFNKIR